MDPSIRGFDSVQEGQGAARPSSILGLLPRGNHVAHCLKPELFVAGALLA